MDFYLKNVSSLPDPRENEMALLGIPEWRQEYILRYMRPGDRRLSLGAWRLLEEALEQQGFSADSVIIGTNGKPECEGVYFNLSHSGEMVLCAVSNGLVGCDIERVTDAPFDVAKRYFSERECRYIFDVQSTTEKKHRFFKLWTLKESYLKMTGEGMHFPLERIEIDPDALTVLRDSVLQSCVLQNTALDGYEISVCKAANAPFPSGCIQ